MRIIAICSGKGGVGKSNFSVNLGIAFSQLGKKVTILDADLGLANINILINSTPRYNLLHFIKKEKKLSEIIQQTEYGIKIISGGSGFSELTLLSEPERIELINEFSILENDDILLIDTPAGASKNVLMFLQAANDIIVITTPEPTALADAYALIKIITVFIPREKIDLKLIVNKANSYSQALQTAEKISNIARMFLSLPIHYLGFIHTDKQMEYAVLNKIPIIIRTPNSRASVSIKHIAKALSDVTDYKSNFEKLFGAL